MYPALKDAISTTDFAEFHRLTRIFLDGGRLFCKKSVRIRSAGVICGGLEASRRGNHRKNRGEFITGSKGNQQSAPLRELFFILSYEFRFPKVPFHRCLFFVVCWLLNVVTILAIMAAARGKASSLISNLGL